MKRRKFLGCIGAATLGASAFSCLAPPHPIASGREPGKAATRSKLSLNQWSLWSDYVGDTSADDWWDVFLVNLRSNPSAILKGTLDPLDFPRLARERYGLDAIELESSLYFAHASDHRYFQNLRQRCLDEGVTCQLISNVWQGNLAGISERRPQQTAALYHPWVDAAAILGCHALLVDVNGRRGDREQLKDAAVAGLSALVEYAAPAGVCIVIENHGWYSSFVPWLVEIVTTVDSPFCKLSVDLGNFCRSWRGGECVEQQYDPYDGVALMMPYARSVSAKTMRFDALGNETRIDYLRMLRIIRESGYDGYLAIEFAGEDVPNDTGIRMTMDLIRRMESRL